MATYLFQVATQADSLLARDAIVNTFHLDDHGVTSDPDGLCEDAAELWETVYGNSRQITAKAYNTGSPPNFPVGSAVRNPGASGASHGPREVALCLSYYGERNLPRTRGRIYICAAIAAQWTMTATRPSQQALDQTLLLGQGIADLGGPDVDWITWSSYAGAHEKVQHAWVDDEWDTMRSRGLRSTARVTASYGE